MKRNSYTFIDLFSGCGGFSCGLEMAGHRCLLGVDSDPSAIKTFAKNHPKAKTYDQPIETLDKKKIQKYLSGKQIDIVIGGPPCQGFSTVGKGKAQDVRNNLFIHFVNIVSWLSPKVIIFENVTGLLAKKNAKVLNNIFQSFEQLGYSMSAKIIRAEDHGAPTQRRRTFIVGTKNCNPQELFPLASNSKLNVQDAWNLWMKNSKGIIENHNLEFTKISNVLEKKRISFIPEGKSIRYAEDEQKFLPPRLRYKVNWNKMPENRFRQKKLHRLDTKHYAPTIMTSSRTYFHPTEDRFLTVREAAALQTFPGNFVFCGSHTAMFKQVGNAVPPLLARAFGEKLANTDLSIRRKKNKSNIDLMKLRSTAFVYRSNENSLLSGELK